MNEILKKLKYKEEFGEFFVFNDKDKLINVEFNNNLDSYFFGLLFCENDEELNNYLETTLNKLQEKDTILWIIYPKKSSKKYKSDLNRDILFEKLKKSHLVGIAMISLNEDWSCFRVRKEAYFKK